MRGFGRLKSRPRMTRRGRSGNSLIAAFSPQAGSRCSLVGNTQCQFTTLQPRAASPTPFDSLFTSNIFHYVK